MHYSFISAMMVILTWQTAALAEDFGELQRKTLRGLPRVYVIVELFGPDVERDGLTRDQIQTEVELRLQQAGVRVLTRSEWPNMRGKPFLYVSVHTLKNSRRYAFHIDVHLREEVIQVRRKDERPIPLDGRSYVSAATWQAGGALGTVGQENVREISGAVADLVDEFIDAYLLENP